MVELSVPGFAVLIREDGLGLAKREEPDVLGRGSVAKGPVSHRRPSGSET